MKYIDREEAYKIVLHYGSYAASAKVADLPSIDLVRCRECKYAHLTYDGDAKYCDLLASKDKYGDCDPFFYRSGDWFCADGEREVQDG